MPTATRAQRAPRDARLPYPYNAAVYALYEVICVDAPFCALLCRAKYFTIYDAQDDARAPTLIFPARTRRTRHACHAARRAAQHAAMMARHRHEYAMPARGAARRKTVMSGARGMLIYALRRTTR